MGNQKRLVVAALNIFLILSAGPVGAARVREDGQHFSELVQPELEIDSHQCGQLQETFTTRTNELDSRATTLQEGGLGARGQLALAMKMRGMVRIVRRATTLNCEWVIGTNSDTQVLESIAARSMEGNPCRGSAGDILMAMEDAPVENQGQMLMTAMQTLMSDNCDAAMPEEQEVVPVPRLDSAATRAEIDRETGQIEEEADNMIDDLAELELSDPSFMQIADEPRSVGGAIGQALVRMVTTVALTLAFALSCAIIGFVVVLILALVTCLIIGFFGLLLWRPNTGRRCMTAWGNYFDDIPMRCIIGSALDQLGITAQNYGGRRRSLHNSGVRVQVNLGR